MKASDKFQQKDWSLVYQNISRFFRKCESTTLNIIFCAFSVKITSLSSFHKIGRLFKCK